MSKLSTKDCRDFLVKIFNQSPEMITCKFDDTESIEQIKKVMSNGNKWKRIRKFKANGSSEFTQSNYRSEVGDGVIPAEKVAWVREFFLNPEEFEDAIGFQVLELNNGDLMLGEFVGD